MTAESDGVDSGPAADETAESPVRFDRLDGPPRSSGPISAPVPVRDPEETWYKATLRGTNAYAFFRPTAGEPEPGNEAGQPELRIPYIQGGRERGQFKQLMDALVLELGICNIRFTNLSPPGAMAVLSEHLGTETHRDLREAVDGFETVEEEWTDLEYESPMSEAAMEEQDFIDTEDETAECLVGRWRPSEQH